MTPWIAIRTDGSSVIGTGHVMRCLTLANALAQLGITVFFFSRRLNTKLANLVRERHHRVISLEDVGPLPTASQGLYGTWLGTTEEFDAFETVTALDKQSHNICAPLFVLVDHYGLASAWERSVASLLQAKICSIDDLNRSHDSDYLVDTTFGKTEVSYRDIVPASCEIMAGAQFALLRPEFATLRPSVLDRLDAQFASMASVKNLLIAMGGADSDNKSSLLLEAVQPLALEYGFHTHILTGAAYENGRQLQLQVDNFGAPATIHDNIRNVAELLAMMDLCVGAAGSSTWERCCLGLPMVNVVLAENQKEISSSLGRSGIAIDGGVLPSGEGMMKEWTSNYILPLLADAGKRKALSEAARSIVDGYGVTRVLRAVMGEIANTTTVTLRRATMQDAELLYQWQCYPQTRRFAGNPAMPKLEGHKAWMEQKLVTDTTEFYLVTSGGVASGMLRLDACSDELAATGGAATNPLSRELSILTAPEFYGYGIATKALALIKAKHSATTIFARVLAENETSHKLFVRAGFVYYKDQYLIWSENERLINAG